MDDTQVYIAADRTYSRQLASLQECLGAVHTWLLHNSLCLNPAKSDVIVFTPSRQQHTTKLDTVSVSSQPVIPSLTVKSLGIVLDNRLSMDQHVADVCKNCYFHIRTLHHVRSSLPDDVVRTVACSIVQSRLDYCNALFTDMSEANLSKLQRVQNTLARGKYEQLTPALSELHWLPVRQRIDFKVATLTFKVRQSGHPTYFSQQLSDYISNRSLRSASQHRLHTQPTRTVLAQRGFTSAAPKIWNSLREDLRNCCSLETFRRKVITHLFNRAFSAYAGFLPRPRIDFFSLHMARYKYLIDWLIDCLKWPQ